jgi:predicted  nucleic acid-binding Zn-ribbon protein
MICKHCGTQISDQAKFCPKCGCPVSVAVQQPQKKKHGVIIAAAILVFVMILGISGTAVYIHMSSRVEDKTELAEAEQKISGDEEDERDVRTELEETDESNEAETAQSTEQAVEPEETKEFETEPEVTYSETEPDYILPDSNIRFLGWNDVIGLSSGDLRLARNEIYARHGRRFNSEDLQNYFNSKSWYQGTIAPEDFREDLFNEYEKENISYLTQMEETAALSVAPSKKIIDQYPMYDNGCSKLAFTLKGGTLQDCGEYYQIDATYEDRIEVPQSLQQGESIQIVVNELTGESHTYVLDGYILYRDGVTPEFEFRGGSSDSAEAMCEVLYYGMSEDIAYKPVHEGKLYIKKNATSEIAIDQKVETITFQKLNYDSWYNAVYFDPKGYVTRLVFEGD